MAFGYVTIIAAVVFDNNFTKKAKPRDGFHRERSWRTVLDGTDLRILKCLKENARTQWKDIGEKVHMTGQAVAARIDRMLEAGIIKRFTVDIDEEKLGVSQSGFITVFMKSNDHQDFLDFVRDNKWITEACRVSGEGCYLLKFGVGNQTELNKLLDNILVYGNYRLSISVNRVK